MDVILTLHLCFLHLLFLFCLQVFCILYLLFFSPLSLTPYRHLRSTSFPFFSSQFFPFLQLFFSSSCSRSFSFWFSYLFFHSSSSFCTFSSLPSFQFLSLTHTNEALRPPSCPCCVCSPSTIHHHKDAMRNCAMSMDQIQEYRCPLSPVGEAPLSPAYTASKWRAHALTHRQTDTNTRRLLFLLQIPKFSSCDL